MIAQPRHCPTLSPLWARGVTNCYLGGSRINTVTRRLATFSGTRLIKKIAAKGLAIQLEGTLCSHWESVGTSLSTTDPWTYAMIVRFDSISGASSIVTMAQTSASGTRDRAVLLTSGGVFGGHLHDGVGRTLNGVTTVVVGRTYTVVLTYAALTLSLYVNGVLDNSRAVATAGFPYGSGCVLSLGLGGGDATQGGLADLTSLAIVPLFLRATKYAWPISLIKAFAVDPYIIFNKPVPRRRIFGMSVGGVTTSRYYYDMIAT